MVKYFLKFCWNNSTLVVPCSVACAFDEVMMYKIAYSKTNHKFYESVQERCTQHRLFFQLILKDLQKNGQKDQEECKKQGLFVQGGVFFFFFFASYIYSKDSLNESVSFTTEVLASFKSYVSFKKIISKKHFQPCPAKEALGTCPINLPSHQETLELNRNKSFSTWKKK